MKSLSLSAIYVNASSERLLTASRGTDPSQPITEKKRWVSGYKRFKEAISLDQQLPLIFAQYAPLTFWAVATDIKVDKTTTTYRFANLRPLQGYRRSDLVVESTGAPLPDEFIRSYSLVNTPAFLSVESSASLAESTPEELLCLEGEPLQRMIIHRRRESKLRDAKITAALRSGNGHLVCEVPGCGFDFLKMYGKLGAGYAQVHHLRPLAKYKKEEETRLVDLAIVCANCHAMIHRGGNCRKLQSLISGAVFPKPSDQAPSISSRRNLRD